MLNKELMESSFRSTCRSLAIGCLLSVVPAASAGDLNPVKIKPAPAHAPFTLAENGVSRVSICVMTPSPSETLNRAVAELQECIAQTTGSSLPIVTGKIVPPAIVIGDCPEAMAAGLDGGKMPVEGFEIKTAADRVYIVGNDSMVDAAANIGSTGTAWGVMEFCERFVGVRWYWPTDRDGRSIIKQPTLKIEPTWLADAPVFRKRVYYPPFSPSGIIGGKNQDFRHLCLTLRGGNSWPLELRVHQPNWIDHQEYRKNRPEIYQLNPDGTRDYHMYCYSNPKTLATFLENIDDYYLRGKAASFVNGNAITVSPPDIGVNCSCPDCQKLFDKNGGDLASASSILTTFVTKLANEVKTRYPGKTVLFLAYMNYTRPPAGVKLPDNVQVQICGMPGIAQYKEPAIMAQEQATIDSWIAATGQKMQDWHYSCWPADRVQAPFAYPHVLKEYYQANRNKTVGSFINGGDPDEWLRFHTTLYAWMKVMWNPDFDVDAAIDEHCKRMYGPAAASVRQLMQIQMDGWEKSRWPGGRLAPKSVYTVSYPKATVEQVKTLLAKAKVEAAGDELTARRVAYYAYCFDDFFKEYAAVMEGAGQHTLVAFKVASNPVIDGDLSDEVWKKAEPALLMKNEDGKEVAARYPTEVRAVFTLDGITLGIRMAEPSPEKLKREVKTNDHGMTYWDDSVDLFFDPSGKNMGDFVQLIVNANGAVQDIKNGSGSWTAEGLKTASKLGQGCWTMEVYVPFKALGDNVRYGTGVTWFGQITRHRMSDQGTSPESIPENQKLNAKFTGFNSNLNDFSPITFRE